MNEGLDEKGTEDAAAVATSFLTGRSAVEARAAMAEGALDAATASRILGGVAAGEEEAARALGQN